MKKRRKEDHRIKAKEDHYALAYFPGIFDKAKRADEWQAEGREWNPAAQVITNTKDDFHYPQVKECIKQHAEGVVAYAIVPVLDEDTLSIELQFGTRAQKLAFHRAYNKVRLHKPKAKGTNGAKQTRLLNERMYILPDGREFWLYGKWDISRRIGKVPGSGPNVIENCIIDDEVLRNSEILPKGEEPWRPC